MPDLDKINEIIADIKGTKPAQTNNLQTDKKVNWRDFIEPTKKSNEQQDIPNLITAEKQPKTTTFTDFDVQPKQIMEEVKQPNQFDPRSKELQDTEIPQPTQEGKLTSQIYDIDGRIKKLEQQDLEAKNNKEQGFLDIVAQSQDIGGAINGVNSKEISNLRDAKDLLTQAKYLSDYFANRPKDAAGQEDLLKSFDNEKQSDNPYENIRPGIDQSTQRMLYKEGLKAGANPKQYWYDLQKGFTSPLAKDFFTLGMNELKRNFNILDITERSAADPKSITTEEQKVLQAYTTFQELQSGKQLPFSYELGKGVVDMIPYMAQFAATNGIGTATSGAITKYLGQKVGLKLLGNALVKGGIKLTARVGAGMTQSVFMPNLENTYAEKRIEQYDIKKDEEGNRFVVEKANSESKIKNAIESFGTNFGEVFFERGSFTQLGVNELGKKLAIKLPSFFKNPVYKEITSKLAKATGYNGVLGEYLEEFETSAWNAAIGEGKWSDLFDGRQQSLTFMTCLVAGMGFKASNLIEKGITTVQLSQPMNKSKSDILNHGSFGKGIVSAMQMPTVNERLKALNNLNWSGQNNEAIIPAIAYIRNKTQFDVYKGFERENQLQGKLSNIENRYNSIKNKSTDTFDVLIDKQGKSMFVVEGNPEATDFNGVLMVLDPETNEISQMGYDEALHDIMRTSKGDAISGMINAIQMEEQQNEILDDEQENANISNDLLNNNTTVSQPEQFIFGTKVTIPETGETGTVGQIINAEGNITVDIENEDGETIDTKFYKPEQLKLYNEENTIKPDGTQDTDLSTQESETTVQNTPKPEKVTFGKSLYDVVSNGDGSDFVSFVEGKDKTKEIKDNVDLDRFDVVPIVEEVTTQANKYAKPTITKVVKGVNIVPKAPVETATAPAPEVSAPVSTEAPVVSTEGSQLQDATNSEVKDISNVSKFYNSHGSTMTLSDLIELEVNERENYTLEDINEWIKKYNISTDAEFIWVTPNPKMALSYNSEAQSKDDAESDMSLSEFEKKWDVSSDDIYSFDRKDGVIIPESEDGDDGYLMAITNTEVAPDTNDVSKTEDVLLNKDAVVNVVNEKQINAKYDAELAALNTKTNDVSTPVDENYDFNDDETAIDYTDEDAQPDKQEELTQAELEAANLRQNPIITKVTGVETNREFATNIPVKGNLTVIDVSELQPSHVYSERNPKHGIPDAQPKERNDKASDIESTKIANNPNWDKLANQTLDVYHGAPTVNSRGEVIQGNNRSEALRKYWEFYPDDKKALKQYLINNAKELGLNPEDISNIKNPVLVNMVDVSDEEAIKLGQYTAQDLETGGKRRITPKETLRKLNVNDVSRFIEIITNGNTDDETIREAIRRNAYDSIKYLSVKKAITDTQFQSAFNPNNNQVTKEALDDLTELLKYNLFIGAEANFDQYFKRIPYRVQNALIKTSHVNSDDKSNSLTTFIQEAVRLYNNYMSETKNGDVMTLEQWRDSVDMFTGESPSDKYTGLSFVLSKMFISAKTEKEIAEKIKKYYQLVNGITEGMFPEPAISMKQALKILFNFVEKTKENVERPVNTGNDSSNDKRAVEGERKTSKERGGLFSSNSNVDAVKEEGSDNGGRNSGITNENEVNKKQNKTKIIIIPNGETSFDRQAQYYIKSFLGKVITSDKIKFTEGKLNYDMFALLNDNGDVVSLNKSPDEAYKSALNYDLESFHIVRETKDKNEITYNYYQGNLFGDYNSNELYDNNGNLKNEVKQNVIDDIYKSFKINKEQPKEVFAGDVLNEVTKEQPQKEEDKPESKYGDKQARYDELKAKLKGKLNNLNAGIDPELFAIGVEMAAIKIEMGVKKFSQFAKEMVEELGDAIKPYLKAIYNGVRDLPEMEEIEPLMDEYSYVKKADIEKEIEKEIQIENKSSNFDNNLNKQNDVYNRPGSSQRNSKDSPDEIPEVKGTVSDDGGTSGQGGNKPTSNKGEIKPIRTKSGSGLFTIDFGEFSDNEVHKENEGISPENDVAGDTDGRGGNFDDRTGQDVDNTGEQDSEIGSDRVDTSFKERTDRKIKEQLNAENIPIKIGDEENIRATLPLLLPEQQDDVLKAETRFFDEKHQTKELAYGKGMLFTNGTGTGKTFTGLGIIKRFEKQGKKNILIVVPTEAKIKDWIKDAEKINLTVTQIQNTKDKGQGINVTTYATFRENQALKERDFDLVVYDESHRLMEDKNGKYSSTTFAHQEISNISESKAFKRITDIHPIWIEYNKVNDEYRKLNNTSNNSVGLDMPEQQWQQHLGLVKKLGEKLDKLNEKKKELEPELKERAKKAYENTKVVFLSATPFKAHFNLRYANGVLFDWGNKTTYESASRGKSRVDAESRYFLDNFGSAYEWKFHRLQTKQKANAEAIAMQEIDYSNKLMQQGVLSGRSIESDKDYSREFPLVALENSELLNKAFNDIFDHVGNEFESLRDSARNVFYNYNYTTKLFEALKTSLVIPRIDQHLEKGRKVVVFHRRKQAGVTPPFDTVIRVTENAAEAILNDENSTVEQKEKAVEMKKQADLFKNKYADLLEYEKTLVYNSAIDQLLSKYGNRIVTINGETPKKDKVNNIVKFNDDNSGVDIILVQEEAGKEGISLHDVTGNHQRVLINLSMPISSTTALQIEGRIFRIGQETNAIFEYPLIGLDMEIENFGRNINRKLSTTENLALGNQARDLLRSFAEGVLFNSSSDAPNDNQGIGGKEYDKKTQGSISEFQKAILVYSSNQKQRGKRDSREGIDYYPTPEPLGQKMVEWADLRTGDTALEPSAGHGAIAMWFPDSVNAVAIEPSFSLYSKLNARSGGGDRKILNQLFEEFNIINKVNAVIMNPPFGKGGLLAIAHVEKAFKHLREGGRVVALIPRGNADKLLDKFLYGVDENGKLINPDAQLIATINLPASTFEQAGTAVNARVVVIDKINYKSLSDFKAEVRAEDTERVISQRGALLRTPEQVNEEALKRYNAQNVENTYTTEYDLSDAKDINDFFNSVEFLNVENRNMVEGNKIPTTTNNTPENAKPNVDGIVSYKEGKHSKTGEILHLGVINEKVERDEYDKINKTAKYFKGYYSSFAKGFIFPNKESADSFVNEINKPDINFRRVSPIGFYSTVEDALSNIKQEKGTAAQFKAMLLKNGAKQAELEWMGWDDQFADNNKMVSKSDIQQWIDENKIEVHDVEKGGFNNGDIASWWNDEGGANEGVDFYDLSESEKRNARERYSNEVGDWGGTDTKFSQYQTTGGENYKELLLTMPSKKLPPKAGDSERIKLLEEKKKNIIDRGNYVQKEIDDINTQIAVLSHRIDKSNDFRGNHYDEPNILAHVRFNERITSADGTPYSPPQRTLFIEEFQSDWAQKGKKEGFDTKDSNERMKEIDILMKQGVDKYGIDKWIKTNEYNNLKSEYNRIKDGVKIPNMPFKQTDQWVKLALRRMIRYAAENGFDRIAWTNGEQQVARYDLSKSIDEVTAYGEKGIYELHINPKQGNMIGYNNIPENKLDEYVGKELANKIIEHQNSEEGKTNAAYYSGLDLKVGGEGMKAFYDQIIPSEANKLIKSFGLKTEPVSINDSKVLSFPINQSLKETALGGLPLFNQEPQLPDNPSAQYVVDNIDLYEQHYQKITDSVNEFTKNMKVTVKVVRTNLNLPLYIQKEISRMDDRQGRGRYPGVYDRKTKTIYIVAHDCKNTTEAHRTAAHEIISHYGLRNLLGSEFAPTMELVYKGMTEAQRSDIMKKYGYKEDAHTDIADEFTARMAEGQKIPSWFAVIIAKIRNFIRNTFGFNLNMSEKDIVYLLWKSKNKLEDDATAGEVMDYIIKDDHVEKNAVKFQIIGEKGAEMIDNHEQVMDNLRVAKEMEATNKDAKTIRLATGWEKGADSKWRYELPDANLKLSLNDINNLKSDNGINTNSLPLSDVLDNKDLFNAYPELKNVNIIFYEYGWRFRNSIPISFITDDTNEIGIGVLSQIPSLRPVYTDNNLRKVYEQVGTDTNDIIKSLLLHEAQHFVQKYEGFARGTTPEAALENAVMETYKNIQTNNIYLRFPDSEKKEIAKQNVLKSVNEIHSSKAGDKLYGRSAGEVEARNTQSRRNLSEEQRRNTLLADTEDVARDQQIILREGGGMAMSYETQNEDNSLKGGNGNMDNSLQNKINILNNTKFIETGETRIDEDYEPDDAEHNQRKVYIPVYINNWEYADNTNPDTNEFNTVDEALSDLLKPGDMSEVDKYYTPVKETRFYIKEAWINSNNDIVDEGKIQSYDDWAYNNKANDFVTQFGDEGYIDSKTFDSREATANELELKVYNGIYKDLLKEYNDFKISTQKQGKYRDITINNSDGEFIDSIQLRLADHSYNPRNNDEDAQKGKFISVEIANKNETAKRFHGKFGLQFNGEDTYETVIDAINERVKEIIDDNIDNSVSFSKKPINPPDGNFDKFIDSKSKEFTQMIQDRTLPIKLMQQELTSKSGVKLDDLNNVWDAANKYRAGASKQMEYFKREQMKPMLASIKKLTETDNKTEQQVNDYLLAKHSLERHDAGEVNALSEDPNSNWNRGIVEAIIKDFESTTTPSLVKDMWSKINDATKFSLDYLYTSGLIAKVDYEKMIKQYQYYVPLRGWNFDDDTNPLEYFKFVSNERSVNSFNNPLIKAKGRTSKPENPLPYISSMGESAIIYGMKNKYKQTALRLMRQHMDRKDVATLAKAWMVYNPNTDTWEETYDPPQHLLDERKKIREEVKTLEKSLNNKTRAERIIIMQQIVDLEKGINIKDTVDTRYENKIPKKDADIRNVIVYDRGLKYQLSFSDPEVANAINGESNIKRQEFRTASEFINNNISPVTRFLSANFTSKNPAFIVPNMIRDLMFASTSHWIQNDGTLMEFYKNIPGAAAAIHRYIRETENSNNPIDKELRSFFEIGGATGYTQLRELEKQQKDIQEELFGKKGFKKGMADAQLYTGLHHLGKVLDYTAMQSEMIARFATYLAAKKAGKTSSEAVSMAKDISVNFDRKGELSGLFGGLYAFFNPSVQGMNVAAKLYRKNKLRFIAACVTPVMFGFVNSLLLSLTKGDDDDYPTDYELANNLMFRVAGGYVKIPLPPFFRAFWGLGANLHRSMISGETEVNDAVYNIMDGIVNATSPINVMSAKGELEKGEMPLRPIVPTFLTPFFDEFRNSDFKDDPIYREMYTKELELYTPDSQKGFKNTNKLLLEGTKAWNKLGGGSEFIPAGTDPTGKESRNGVINYLFDRNPAKIEHYIEYYTGGRGKVVNDITKTITSVFDKDVELSSYNIPIANRFFSTNNAKRNINPEYFAIRDRINTYDHYLSQSKTALTSGDIDKQAVPFVEMLKETDMFIMLQKGEMVDKQMKIINKQLDEQPAKELKKQLYEEKQKLMKDYIDEFKKVVDKNQ